MTNQKFESFTSSIALNTIRFDLGEIEKDTYIENMRIILGETVYEKVSNVIIKGKKKAKTN